jgi:transcriptional regulator with XRE-family HTH domain
LTTPELANLVGVTDASITQTEAGQTLPRKPTVKSYEQALGVSLAAAWERDVAKRKASKKETTKSRAARAPKTATTPPPPQQQPPQRGALATGDPVTPDVLQGRDRLIVKHKAKILKHKERAKKGGKKK